MRKLVLIRGGGDLASGVALRLFRSGFDVVIAELEQPLVIRRTVAFAEAIYSGETTVEGVRAKHVEDFSKIIDNLHAGIIPVIVDPSCTLLDSLGGMGESAGVSVLVDGRMTKRQPELGWDSAYLVIGLGPGFVAGKNCHAVIETNRGHFLGRVIWQGAPSPDTGVPEGFGEKFRNRVLRAPSNGVFRSNRSICDQVEEGALVAEVNGDQVHAPFNGVIRGLLHPGLVVKVGDKIGDIDPRNEPGYCWSVSDKALAVAGGVLEAILVFQKQHPSLWE